MEAKSTDKKSLQLNDNGQLLGELIYESVFSLKAGIRLNDSESYKIEPVGFLGTTITVAKDGTEIANLKMNWHGNIVLSFQNGQDFVLKAKGMFQTKFILENTNQERLVQFDPKFNWSKFDYNYDITYDKKPDNILLVLLGIYASNYFIASMSGAMSGMG
ncbi:hypothetical protein [Dyadobacter sp. CY312]|uniref:hypothetical protein n=1 Tax=Dyadobacter sp. CY312 TaxID=2907303 RepID=UPI001F39064F|nr:hypothetical protein [Dyadobacter sp. CY312]MCE7040358.1 hypothetical protein [Dyadobacter sp. CY312]